VRIDGLWQPYEQQAVKILACPMQDNLHDILAGSTTDVNDQARGRMSGRFQHGRWQRPLRAPASAGEQRAIVVAVSKFGYVSGWNAGLIEGGDLL
jgi:hypothetical protein